MRLSGPGAVCRKALTALVPIFLLIALSHAPSSFAQEDSEGPLIENSVSAEAAAYIEVKDGLLSVKLYDIEFGKAAEGIANKAGFETDINDAVYARKLTTSFKGLSLERGLVRMLNLIREKNYTIYYDKAGRISRLEVLGGRETASPPVQTAPVAPRRGIERQPVRIQPVPFTPGAGTMKRPPVPALPPLPLELDGISNVPADLSDDEIEEIMDEPYESDERPPMMPRKDTPVYIPMKTE
ncbi:MAG: hypothetical protein Q8J64_04560 [Thermodesulfovibrionales bacterium]|nr:hypothetical protein [Thermodesulfovibrionales bacterium]